MTDNSAIVVTVAVGCLVAVLAVVVSLLTSPTPSVTIFLVSAWVIIANTGCADS